MLDAIDLQYPGGMDEKTLYAHYRAPHRQATQHITHIIQQLHEQVFPNPFPADVEALLLLYNHLQQSKKHSTRDADIDSLEVYVRAQCALEPDARRLRRARLTWLLGNIAFDRLAALRDSGQRELLARNKLNAITAYQQALDDLECCDNNGKPLDAFLIYKLRQNILACYLNSVHENKRDSDPEIRQYLAASDYLQQSRLMLKQEPFQWTIARNGLRFCSLLQDGEGVAFFFNHLIAAYKGFENLDYSPNSQPALRNSSSFQWAITHIIEPQKINH
jgi:hypothetical protein